MSKIEGPQVMAAIVTLGVLAIVVAFVAPTSIQTVIGSVVTGIVALGMKLLDKNGSNEGNGKNA